MSRERFFGLGPPGEGVGGHRRDALRRLAWLAFFGFLLHGNWEWLQTPFYDEGGAGVMTVVWNRFHCTVVDVGILIGCALVISVTTRSLAWLSRPRSPHMAAMALLGAVYTALSEQINVGVNSVWAYSPLMPLLPGTSIGLIPLLQWLLIPVLATWLASRLR